MNINHEHFKHGMSSIHNTWAFAWIKPLNKKWSHELSGQTDHKKNNIDDKNGLYVYIDQSQSSTLTWELTVSVWTYIPKNIQL